MIKSIYELKLHEVMELDDLELDILRVPGGWLYNSVFVPYSNEFKNSEISDRLNMTRKTL